MNRAAFSMLEMLLALAILGTSLAIIAGIADTGADAAVEADNLNQLRMLAQSQLNQVLTSDLPPQPTPLSPMESMDSESAIPLQYQLDVQPGQLEGILNIRVTVNALSPDDNSVRDSVSFTRWMIDPLLGLPEMAEEEQALWDSLNGEGDELDALGGL